MRISRKLFLLVAMVVAAMAMTASSAFAQAVEVIDEADNQPCGAVSVVNHDAVGGCTLHVTSTAEVALFQHDFASGNEAPLSLCDNEFEGHINADGTGLVDDQVLSGPNCAIEACEEVENVETRPWPFVITETAPNHENLEVQFCVQPRDVHTQQTPCTIDVAMEDVGDHLWEFVAVDEPCHESPTVPFEVTGHWLSDTSEGEVEVLHH